ncbi:aminoglycoside phosphotransferase family protein [Paenibacillus thalictri]|nr:aminoglycoside phosphotransferase family protein [Paenibacillus thalictri]
MHLPATFRQNIVGVHRQKGENWLSGLEELIAYCERRWSCVVQRDHDYPLSYNFVAPVRFQDGRPAVIKLGVPSGEIHLEVTALRHYNGNGAVRLLEADEERGILILEKLSPGATLKSVKDDEEATLIAADVMKKMRRPAPDNGSLPSVGRWAEGLSRFRADFGGGTGPLPEQMVAKAEKLYAELLSSASRLQLLHGDLHHDNILSSERGPWLAIDPKGLIGEPEYEVISFLMNHLPEQGVPEAIRRRVDIFAKRLDLNTERIYGWAYCHAVLSASWHVEDRTGGEKGAIELAKVFERSLTG